MLMFRILFITLILTISTNYSIAKDQCVDNIIETGENNNLNQTNVNKLATQANFFFDTSQNMVGFINSASSSYKLFISELIKKSPLFSENQTFQRYFANIETVDVNNIGGVTTNKKFYQCPGDIPSGECHKIKTKLSSVLTAVNYQGENELAIIVTDLFLQVEELLTKENRDKLVKPFANALNRGDAVGVFGIQSAYEGRIFGICPDNTQTKRTTYSNATSRPFFVILIGNKDIILNFKDLMDETVIPKIGTDKVEFNLFTNDIIKSPYTTKTWPAASFIKGNGIKQGDVLEVDNGNVKELIVSKGNQPLDIQINLEDIQTPYTLPLTDFSATTQGFLQMSKKGSCNDQWYDFGVKDNITYFKNQENSLVTFDIFSRSKDESMTYSRNFNYIFQIDFKANSIGGENIDVWMRDSSWTFSCEQADMITDPTNGRTKFPVLNLNSFYDLLEQVQKENFTTTSISKLNLGIHMSK
ncbi:hypothetical protein N8761_00845 [Alphaproteobacteria bacterium]|nr:hypothetical protein [Alphaproteobacteria bacterium]